MLWSIAWSWNQMFCPSVYWHGILSQCLLTVGFLELRNKPLFRGSLCQHFDLNLHHLGVELLSGRINCISVRCLNDSWIFIWYERVKLWESKIIEWVFKASGKCQRYAAVIWYALYSSNESVLCGARMRSSFRSNCLHLTRQPEIVLFWSVFAVKPYS